MTSYHKLYFRHGTVSSAKSMNLLAVAHNYDQKNSKILVMKPAIDTRDGKFTIESRTGLTREADIIIKSDAGILDVDYTDINCVLVDESQFLTSSQIEALREITKYTPVICYGLRTDFTGRLFEGSKRLMELANVIEEIKTVCYLCNSQAILNIKLDMTNTEQIELSKTLYKPVCYRHFK